MNTGKDLVINHDYNISCNLNEAEEVEENQKKRKCEQFLRRLTVEPLILFYGITLYPVGPVTQQV